MKTNKIIKKQVANGGSMIVLVFAQKICDFDTDQVGNVINTIDDEVHSTGTELEVGDSITDDFGGEPIIASVHGKSEEVTIKNAFGTLVDYRDAFQQKHTGEGEN